jgi:hypothetical protein
MEFLMQSTTRSILRPRRRPAQTSEPGFIPGEYEYLNNLYYTPALSGNNEIDSPRVPERPDQEKKTDPEWNNSK